MEINIDARVITRDGKVAGRISRVVIDPETHDLQSLVVTTGGRVSRDLVVPLNVVQSTKRDEALLRIDEWELAEMPQLLPEAFARPEEHFTPPAPYQPGAVLFPKPVPHGAPPNAPPAMETVPPGSAVVREGLQVFCVDGPCGTVDEVLTDVYLGRVTEIVVRKGTVFTKDVRIPVNLINEISDTHIRVAATKAELERLMPLPPADFSHEEGPAAEHRHERPEG